MKPATSIPDAFDHVEYMRRHGHEELYTFHDKDTDLYALIALHDTTLGPGLGGTRIREVAQAPESWKEEMYVSDAEGVWDVLRLAEGMTYKAAVAGLPLGGGKAVILGDGKEKKDAALRAARFQAFGRFVDGLGGRYITTEDSGTSPDDMREIRKTTRFVVGTPREEGGGGDPSPTTAYGVVRGMLALAEGVLARSNLEGVRVAVQGLGHVGMSLVERLLLTEGATVIAADTKSELIQAARERFASQASEGRFDIVAPEQIHQVECDILAPCAFGGILNPQTIPELHHRCRVVAGAANNQLEDEKRDSEALRIRGITYAVDYVINSGGLIHVAQDLDAQGAWSETDDKKVTERAHRIYDTVRRMLELAEAENISTVEAARRMALEAIKAHVTL
ncbi:MAG TPA: Glu/Leu/Phe/Val dehydrogenase dimerization domain-containing protein [Ktedonobacterales bacterium]|nr:Glu/Leu/Phe/Val dehydrogenase dimerization domain-containing protein [Ktedonobacterales bacterium]